MVDQVAYTKEWITQVRGNMDKTSFGKQVVVYKKNGTICSSVHRNTIGNWESGKTSLPKDVETFLSIALFEYDKEHEADKTPSGRNARYLHAKNRLAQMLGLELYARNLHDALLISVCRGILSFKEVLSLEKELEEELAKDAMPKEERDLYAIKRNTIPISEDLNKVSSVEELWNCITKQHRNSFASANRIIGARMLQIYNKRERYSKKVSFYRAVANLAPNYKDSYTRMFTSSFISRDWMIDLCRHLDYSREEIASILEAAHMVKLSEEELFLDPLSIFADMPVVTKFETMFLLAFYVHNRCLWDMKDFPPAIHLLESFAIYDQGKAAIQFLNRLADQEEADDWSYQELMDRLMTKKENKKGMGTYNPCTAWMKYLDQEDIALREEESLKQKCREKTPDYDVLPASVASTLRDQHGRIAGEQVRNEMRRIRYLTSMCYTVLRGTVFEGRLREVDLSLIEQNFAKEDKDYTYIYRLISKMLAIFLGDQPVRQTGNGLYNLEESAKEKPKTALGMERILETFWQSILFLKGRL